MRQQQYPEVADDFGHWLAGFIDGEGCFYIAKQGSGFAMRFVLKLRDDDVAVLEEAHQRTGLGKIYRRGVSRGQTAGAKPQVAWHIGTKDDTLQLVRLLDRYPLRSKKMLDFMLWREAVLYRKDGRNRPRAAGNWGPIRRLYDDLKAVREYVPIAREAQAVEGAADHLHS